MSVVDIVIVVFALSMAAIGWERGLMRSALPLVGFIGGVAVGARLGPALLAGGAESAYAPAVAAAAGILLGVFIGVALEGVGTGLSERLAATGGSRAVDGAGGAILLAALALTAAWVFGAVALHAPGSNRDLRETVQRSAVLAALNEAFPPSGPLLNTLRRIDPTPSVRGPEADVRPPDRAVLDSAELRAASGSVVRVRGSACGLGVEGSGWIGGSGIVVTNAHVVAGQDDTVVVTGEGEELGATAVHYEPRNDLAVLSVAGLTGSPLRIERDPVRGTAGAAVGYPGGGPLNLSPVRIGRTGTVASDDSYGRGPVQRRMTPFRGVVRGGSSGGPVLDGGGRVLATVFAASLGGGPPSGLAVPNEITLRALEGRLESVDTGPCAA